jgi:RimJ/RimL family protein N-acetyltransferase
MDIITDLLFLLYNDEEQAPDLSREELLVENEQLFADTNQIFFLAFDGDKPVGVSHGSLRREYVNGANDGLKGYLEAIYVLPDYRKNGIAAELDKIIGRWAASHGCREMASDCLIDNTDSYNFHCKIGYEETERCIFFLKSLEPHELETRLFKSGKPLVRLATERLFMRDYKKTDLEEMYRLWSDKETMYYLDDILCHSIEDTEKYLNIGIANSDGHYFCITEKSSDNFIGSIGYTITETTPFGNIVHMGYMMFPEYHGRGYMTEAALEMINFAFTMMVK